MKTVIVTGAAGYFGKYLVEELSKTHNVVATSRNIEKLNQMFTGPNVIKLELDFYDTAKSEKNLSAFLKNNEVHALINNAYDFTPKTGFNTADGRYETISIDAMRAGLDSGLLGPMLMSQLVGRQMIERQIKGSIINISSMYGLVAPDRRLYEGKTVYNPVTYGVAKAGLNGLTRYIASFWGEHGIRCNSIAPGAFPNEETQSDNATTDVEFKKRLENKSTLGRTGHPKDLFGLVDLLLSEKSSYITGQVLSVDGGWTAI